MLNYVLSRSCVMRVRHEVGSARQYAVIGCCPGNDMTAPSFLWPPPEVTANKFYTIDVLNNNGLSFFLEYRYVKAFTGAVSSLLRFYLIRFR